jgi:hypothetical protein
VKKADVPLLKDRPIPENEIAAAVENNFCNHGWVVIPTHYGRDYRPIYPGISDFIMVKNGFHCWVETKKSNWIPPGPTRKPTKTEKAQEAFRQMIRAAKGTYVRIQTIEELGRDLAALDRKASNSLKTKEMHMGGGS